MKVIGIRFCAVSPEAQELADFLGNGLGLPQMAQGGAGADTDTFMGAVFPAGESWIEVWPEGPEMPVGVMLQIVVDDADAWAEQARSNGLAPEGPNDAHGERAYFVQAPGGIPVTFQSRLPV